MKLAGQPHRHRPRGPTGPQHHVLYELSGGRQGTTRLNAGVAAKIAQLPKHHSPHPPASPRTMSCIASKPRVNAMGREQSKHNSRVAPAGLPHCVLFMLSEIIHELNSELDGCTHTMAAFSPRFAWPSPPRRRVLCRTQADVVEPHASEPYIQCAILEAMT